jgi:hypothetical protein
MERKGDGLQVACPPDNRRNAEDEGVTRVDGRREGAGVDEVIENRVEALRGGPEVLRESDIAITLQ